MNRIILLLSISIFGIFVGSQITEGVLIVSYWKSLSVEEFYEYYTMFGPAIGRFYTILTIIAVLISTSISIYSYFIKSPALKYALVSTFFAFLFLSLFYIYFKDANQQFYDAAFNAIQLKAELETWESWHWLRVIFETLALIFLIIAIHILNQKENTY